MNVRTANDTPGLERLSDDVKADAPKRYNGPATLAKPDRILIHDFGGYSYERVHCRTTAQKDHVATRSE